MKLKDRVAIVTGAASGIGAASARLFAAEGARLALVDQDKDGLGQVAADIEAAGGSAIIFSADVSSDAQARAGVGQVMEKWGRIDVLMTAAGMSTGGTVDTTEEAAWDRTFAVNVKGTYLWIHHAIKPMIVAKSGAIVTVGSQLAQSSPGKNAAYVASKGAIASFTKTIAVDHAHQGIRVNALMPGVIDTPMPAKSLKRYADPEAMRHSGRCVIRWAASASPRRWRARPCSWRATTRPSSPARCCSSTAGGRRIDHVEETHRRSDRGLRARRIYLSGRRLFTGAGARPGARGWKPSSAPRARR